MFKHEIEKILSYMKYASICLYMKYRNIDLGLISGSEFSWRRECLPPPVFSLGEFHGQRWLPFNNLELFLRVQIFDI